MNLRLLIFLIFISAAFKPDLAPIKTIALQADFFTTDNLGHAYTVKNDALEKYDRNGLSLATFSMKTLGKITRIDASDPLKLLLHYGDISQVLYLDNTLSMIASIPLEHYGLEWSTLVCASYNDHLWAYHPGKHEIIRYGFSDVMLEKSASSGDLNQLLGMQLNPNFMTEHANRVFLNDPAAGILVFDVFGTYSKTIPIKDLSVFQVNGDKLYYVKNGYLRNYDIKTMAEDSLALPDPAAISARVEKDRMYLHTADAVKVYEIK